MIEIQLVSKKFTKKQERRIEKLVAEIEKIASKVVEEYNENPSEISGSVVQVHENSPYVASREERLKTMEGLNKDEEKDKQ